MLAHLQPISYMQHLNHLAKVYSHFKDRHKWTKHTSIWCVPGIRRTFGTLKRKSTFFFYYLLKVGSDKYCSCQLKWTLICPAHPRFKASWTFDSSHLSAVIKLHHVILGVQAHIVMFDQEKKKFFRHPKLLGSERCFRCKNAPTLINAQSRSPAFMFLIHWKSVIDIHYI